MERKPIRIDLSKAKHKIISGGAEAWRIMSREGYGMNLDTWHTRFSPGDRHEWHEHNEDELIYIIKGKGRYEIEGGAIEFQAGDYIFMPRNTQHQSVASDDGDVELIAIFQPARE
jgi:quercetin dioxygenase-like cupin family protein